jgi:PhnB protein
MTFYGRCLAGEPNFTPFSAGPPEVSAQAKDTPDRILHAELASGPVVLMASDTLPGMPFQLGNNFSICLDCESQAEMDKVFNALSEKVRLHATTRRILGRAPWDVNGSIRY